MIREHLTSVTFLRVSRLHSWYRFGVRIYCIAATYEGTVPPGERFGSSSFKPSSISILKPDLHQIVTDPTGTAHGIDGVPGWTVSGKTGTAQTKVNGPEWGWFVAMAQRTGEGTSTAGKNSQYLIVMALANTQKDGGSHLAAHQVRQFLHELH